MLRRGLSDWDVRPVAAAASIAAKPGSGRAAVNARVTRLLNCRGLPQRAVNQEIPGGMNLSSGSFDSLLGKAGLGSDTMFSSSKYLNKNVKSVLAAAALLAVAALPTSAQAFNSPFAAMSGSWSGSGTITTSNGNKERIRCRAKYDVDGDGSKLDLTLRCARDSYNFELQSSVAHRNGAVSGNWSENTRHVSGNIEGSANGNAISVRVSGWSSETL